VSSQWSTDPGDMFTVGVNFGTLSGRAVVVRVSDGAELGSAVHEYPHAVMDLSLTAGPAARSGQPMPLPVD
jgi:L-ribulokinase